MPYSKIKQGWLALPENADEPMIADAVIKPFLEKLGFQTNEILEQCPTGLGSDVVDVAARKSTPDNNFWSTKTNPTIVVELKRRDRNIAPGKPEYRKVVGQLKRYLNKDAENCHQVQWGIICNAEHIQLFRKHGRVVIPYTENLKITEKNIDSIFKLFKISLVPIILSEKFLEKTIFCSTSCTNS